MPPEFYRLVPSQFFWPIKLNELLDYNSFQVLRFVEGCKDPKELADKVIKVIEYPFVRGHPDDTHILNCFKGKWCRTITHDFWQPASWTAAIGIGDCEDSSILYVAGARALGVPPQNVYVVFGYVRTAEEILGGHAWAYIKHESFGDLDYHYIETTLDKPPKQYPAVQDITKPFVCEDWMLIPEILWNDQQYKVITSAELLHSVARFITGMRKFKHARATYWDLRFKEKETRRKYQAIASMWKMPVKPLKKANLFSKMRWRK